MGLIIGVWIVGWVMLNGNGRVYSAQPSFWVGELPRDVRSVDVLKDWDLGTIVQ